LNSTTNLLAKKHIQYDEHIFIDLVNPAIIDIDQSYDGDDDGDGDDGDGEGNGGDGDYYTQADFSVDIDPSYNNTDCDAPIFKAFVDQIKTQFQLSQIQSLGQNKYYHNNITSPHPQQQHQISQLVMSNSSTHQQQQQQQQQQLQQHHQQQQHHPQASAAALVSPAQQNNTQQLNSAANSFRGVGGLNGLTKASPAGNILVTNQPKDEMGQINQPQTNSSFQSSGVRFKSQISQSHDGGFNYDQEVFGIKDDKPYDHDDSHDDDDDDSDDDDDDDDRIGDFNQYNSYNGQQSIQYQMFHQFNHNGNQRFFNRGNGMNQNFTHNSNHNYGGVDPTVLEISGDNSDDDIYGL
jgi:hypothetical protein